MTIAITGNLKTFTQIKQTVLRTPWSQQLAAQTPTLIPGLEVSIVPLSTTSKVLVMFNVCGSSAANGGLVLFKNGIKITDATGSYSVNGKNFSASIGYGITYEGWSTSFQYIDSPATTSKVTYSVYCQNTGQWFYINRTPANLTDENFISSITAIEIGGY